MGLELLLALGIPILLLVGGTLYFAARGQFPQVRKHLKGCRVMGLNI
jgi:hypothetical protein